MNINKLFFLLILLSFWVGNINAQSKGNKRVNKSHGNWSFGAGINMVDDSGLEGKKFFNIKENWNISVPFTVNMTYYINEFWGVSLEGSLNKYVSGKNIDNTGFIIEGFAANYSAIDLSGKFHFGDLFTSYHFDTYVFLGVGYNVIGAYRTKPFVVDLPVDIDPQPNETDDIPRDAIGYNIPEIGKVTINSGIGFNYWFAETLGINFNFTGKVGVSSGEFKSGPNSVSNHAQFSLGLIYFFSKSKDSY